MLKYGESIKIGTGKIAVWYNGQIRIVDQQTGDSILLRDDEVKNLTKMVSQNQSSATEREDDCPACGRYIDKTKKGVKCKFCGFEEY